MNVLKVKKTLLVAMTFLVLFLGYVDESFSEKSIQCAGRAFSNIVSCKIIQEESEIEIIPLATFVTNKRKKIVQKEDNGTFRMLLANRKKEQAAKEAPEQIKKGNQKVDLSKLSNFDYLLANYYTVDNTTTVDENLLNVKKMLSSDVTINNKKKGPKILIFHTHSQEAFQDSVAGDSTTTIVGMGAYLAELLNEKGIETLHHDGVYDLVNGKMDRSAAYELSEVGVRKILEKNPSIEVVIDLHRDGVKEQTRLVSEINGKPTAKIMFFNGLSRTKTNGVISYLPNPYIQDNLAFSLQMQLACNEMYPDFARRIYLKGYRYSLHMMPKSLLIEAGAQNNTVEEMRNAMECLSNVLWNVLSESS